MSVEQVRLAKTYDNSHHDNSCPDSHDDSHDDATQAVISTLSSQLRKGKMLLGIDRDGTLVPIQDRPEEAIIEPAVAEVIRQLSYRNELTIAIVSARSIAQLRTDFPDCNLILAGNYGMEIAFTTDDVRLQPDAHANSSRLRAVRDQLAPFTIPGINAVLEDHGLSLCLHWHTVPAEFRDAIHERVENLRNEHGNLCFKILPTSYEVLPIFNWDKGRALAEIDAHLCAGNLGAAENLGPAENFGPNEYAYFGDAPADEPAFSWVNSKQGLSVRIGSGGNSTVSKLQLSGTQELRTVLFALRDNLGNGQH